jgi:hypothetical protein
VDAEDGLMLHSTYSFGYYAFAQKDYASPIARFEMNLIDQSQAFF